MGKIDTPWRTIVVKTYWPNIILLSDRFNLEKLSIDFNVRLYHNNVTHLLH